MNETVVEEFRVLLTTHFGWSLDDDRRRLAQVLESRLGLRQSPHDYVAALRHATAASPEVRALAEALAVSETYFFRNPEQFAVLADVALPAMAARRGGDRIRILSAGSASGEEAYSIAMTVLRVRRHLTLPPVEILGVDVSRRAVEKARRGRYSAWALRGLPQTLRGEFFHHDGQHFDVRREVASMVRFEERNLLDLAQAAPGAWDIVFFRNTSMYFTSEVTRAVFAQVAAATAPGSFLFLGHAETLRGISDAFSLHQSHQTFYYQREPATAATTVPQMTAEWTQAPASATSPATGDTTDDEWFHQIARATDRVAALVDARDAGRPEAARAEAALVPAPSSPGHAATTLAAAMSLLAQERHDAALDALGSASDPEHLLLRAVLLANMGRVEEAKAACAAVLAADSLHAGAHYVRALCEERGGNDAAATRHDEMAAYLDDTFAMPHLHLALLARKRSDRAAARRHAQRARDLFADEDELRILLFGGGFNRQALVQLCDAQLHSLAS